MTYLNLTSNVNAQSYPPSSPWRTRFSHNNRLMATWSCRKHRAVTPDNGDIGITLTKRSKRHETMLIIIEHTPHCYAFYCTKSKWLHIDTALHCCKQLQYITCSIRLIDMLYVPDGETGGRLLRVPCRSRNCCKMILCRRPKNGRFPIFITRTDHFSAA